MVTLRRCVALSVVSSTHSRRGQNVDTMQTQTASQRSRWFSAAVAAVLAATALVALPMTPDAPMQRVIVSGVSDVAAVAQAVRAAGGEVLREIGIIDGVVAEVPATNTGALRSAPGVRGVSLDGSVEVHGVYDGFDAATNAGSLATIAKDVIGAGAYWQAGFTGQGVDVAIIDTGAAEVAGLNTGNVLHGPDLSFDSQFPELIHTDGYGHGTHLAGIIAGREDASTAPVAGDTSRFNGIAPGARVVAVKIGDHGGVSDVSQAIAAIDWVVQHRNTDGLNIRVLNLSFGYDSANSYADDPLAYAAEVAWRKGIVVVAAAGNGGAKTRLSSPAYDPHIIAVGATDSMMTATTSDDVIPTWSSCDTSRNPDVVAPGRSIASLRVPGGYVDSTYASARLNDYLTKGSGTSQAAAVVSGAAALIISQRPSITPNGVRLLLNSTAGSIQKSAPKKCQGNGVISLAKAFGTPTPTGTASWAAYGNGRGSLEAARGGYHVADMTMRPDDPNAWLTGERDIFGRLGRHQLVGDVVVGHVLVRWAVERQPVDRQPVDRQPVER